MRAPTTPPSFRSRLTRAYLRYLASTTKPIVLGPWRSELGFEVLYWLPFLHWALGRYKIAPERCIALSRGGMGAFYPAARNVDLYELSTVDEVRLENSYDAEQRKMLKQMSVTAWDRAIAAEAAEKFQLPKQFHLLHPSWMYWLFEPVWEDRATMAHVARHAQFGPLPVCELPKGLELPKDFVAVRFYERHTFPLHEQIANMAREMVHRIATRYPVVLLNQSLFADDHTDLPVAGPNIFLLPEVKPEQNLLLQAAVLARASAFIGTYGGVAQWALRYGKPSLSFYTQFTGTAHAHRTLSNVLAAKMNVPFEVMDLRATKLHEVLYRVPVEKAEAVPA